MKFFTFHFVLFLTNPKNDLLSNCVTFIHQNLQTIEQTEFQHNIFIELLISLRKFIL